MRPLLKACALTWPLLSALSSFSLAQQVTEKGKFGDWTLHIDGETPHQFCFVTSEPKATTPKGATREAPRVYISAWLKDGVKSEVSFRMGFPVKKASEGTVTVSAAKFAVFGAKDRVFVDDSTQELKLVEAMKKGSEMTVAVTSERGTSVVDTYSLSGIGQALQQLQQTCF